MNELKDCPFCGSKVEIKNYGNLSCIVCIDKNSICKNSDLTITFLSSNIEKAIDTWNHRSIKE
jgi:hypothetical protein